MNKLHPASDEAKFQEDELDRILNRHKVRAVDRSQFLELAYFEYESWSHFEYEVHKAITGEANAFIQTNKEGYIVEMYPEEIEVPEKVKQKFKEDDPFLEKIKVKEQ